MKTRIIFLMPVLVFAVFAGACLTVERAQLWRPATCGPGTGSYTSGCPYTSLGEVKNNTDSFYGWTSVMGTYYDAAGNILAEDAVPTCTGLVNPHDSAPFRAVVELTPGTPEIVSYSLRVLGQPITDVLPNHLSVYFEETTPVLAVGMHSTQDVGPDIALVCDQPSYNLTVAPLTLDPCPSSWNVGIVRNNGDSVYDSPTVCMAFYNSRGSVNLVESSSVAPSLAPGESAAFCVPGFPAGEGPPAKFVGPTTGVRFWLDATQRGSPGAVMPLSTAVIPIDQYGRMGQAAAP